MINRLLEKMIQFLMKRYVARKGMFSNYSLSFDDKDFIYVWVWHDRAQMVFDAMREAVEKARTNDF